MKLYAGTTEQFRTDAQLHRIAEKLRAEYTTQMGHRPAPSEVASGQSRRLDAMLTGHSPTSAENAVVVELKQWSDGTIGPSTADNCVEPRSVARSRRVPATA